MITNRHIPAREVLLDFLSPPFTLMTGVYAVSVFAHGFPIGDLPAWGTLSILLVLVWSIVAGVRDQNKKTAWYKLESRKNGRIRYGFWPSSALKVWLVAIAGAGVATYILTVRTI